jgi:hypothetical protein
MPQNMAQPATPIRRDRGMPGLSHSLSFDQRRRPDTLRTAMATAFFCPTSTTCRGLRSLPPVAAPGRFSRKNKMSTNETELPVLKFLMETRGLTAEAASKALQGESSLTR